MSSWVSQFCGTRNPYPGANVNTIWQCTAAELLMIGRLSRPVFSRRNIVVCCSQSWEELPFIHQLRDGDRAVIGAPSHPLNFRDIASFRKQRALNSTRSKICMPKFTLFSPYKTRGGWPNVWVYTAIAMTQPRIYCSCGSAARAGIYNTFSLPVFFTRGGGCVRELSMLGDRPTGLYIKFVVKLRQSFAPQCWFHTSDCCFVSKLHCVSKKGPTCKLSVTLSNLNRFSKFLHCWKAYKIRYKTDTKLPTSP